MLVLRDGYARLIDLSGKDMGRSKCVDIMDVGSTMTVSGKVIEIESIMTKEDYRRFFASTKHGGVAAASKAGQAPSLLTKSLSASSTKLPSMSLPQSTRPLPARSIPSSAAIKLEHSTGIVAEDKPLQNEYRMPLLDKSTLQSGAKSPGPRHDPTVPGALVMTRPQSNTVPAGKQVVDVVVDPLLTSRLREHQREGVKFMYECVMGLRGSFEGAILADEMGLGKSLQVVALLWTLLKQNPIYEDKQVIRKAVIVCPATLVRNWKSEFAKWVGKERIGVFCAEDSDARIQTFLKGRGYHVCILSYEKLTRVQEELQKGDLVDIIIADEGHRLKTAKNKSAQAIRNFTTQKRIVLSGTPLQNDLSEFYFVIDLVNPGQLEKPGVFKRKYEAPILCSRDDEATPDAIEEGQARFTELMELTGKFILRRDASILAKYLPPKSDHVVFCKPTLAQSRLYSAILQSDAFNSCVGSSKSALLLINVLKKVCNSPTLLKDKASSDDDEVTDSNLISALLRDLDPKLLKTPAVSAKFGCLDNLLYKIRAEAPTDKVVLVSHYTATLDILAQLLTSVGYSFLRLDGSTPQNKRQGLVNKFNKSDADGCFAFLLSAKSGGAGLNLIGANRLILYDVDWNPSTDAQAMARIHRDGQKKHCHIYRLMTDGALDEKIYQRQLTKQALADSVVDNRVSTSTFSKEELRRLFTFDERDGCQTHELLGCPCGGRGADVSAAMDDIPVKDAVESHASSKPRGSPERGFVPSSQFHSESRDEEEQKPRADKGKMASLMQYRHLDANVVRAGGLVRLDRGTPDAAVSAAVSSTPDNNYSDCSDEDGFVDIDTLLSAAPPQPAAAAETAAQILHDAVLASLIEDRDSRISFIFTRTHGGEAVTHGGADAAGAKRALEDYGVARAPKRKVCALLDEE